MNSDVEEAARLQGLANAGTGMAVILYAAWQEGYLSLLSSINAAGSQGQERVDLCLPMHPSSL